MRKRNILFVALAILALFGIIGIISEKEKDMFDRELNYYLEKDYEIDFCYEGWIEKHGDDVKKVTASELRGIVGTARYGTMIDCVHIDPDANVIFVAVCEPKGELDFCYWHVWWWQEG